MPQEPKWSKDREGTARIKDVWATQMPGAPTPDIYKKEMATAIVGREPVGPDYDDPDPRWHISVSRPDRVPTWEEMVAAAHELRPGVCFVIGVPPKSWWLNVHPNCLHLWELRDTNLINQWRSERRGDQPT